MRTLASRNNVMKTILNLIAARNLKTMTRLQAACNKDVGGMQPCIKLIKSETIDSCAADVCKPPSVVIVGAGMAGLSAANRLSQCGITSYTVIEATDRPGGRIHSCWLGDVVAELGAQWIFGGTVANSVFTLACQEGLLEQPVVRDDGSRGLFLSSDGRAIDHSISLTAYHSFKQIEQQAVALFGLACGRQHGALNNFMGIRIQQELENFPEDQRYDAACVMYGMTNNVRGRWGADLSLISADQYGSYIEIPGGAVRIPLGFVGIIAPLVRGIPEGHIKYCKPVTKIEWGLSSQSSRAIVKTCDGDEFPADYVIVTVSLGVLKKEAANMFCPSLPVQKMEAIQKLGYGNLNKFFLYYERPFWVWQEGSMRFAWSMDELGDRGEWVRGLHALEEMPGSKHVLIGTVSGGEAMAMENCTDEEIAEEVTRLLRKFTGDATLPYPSNVLRSKWSSDPNFLGASSYMGLDSTVGHQCDLGAPLPGPCDTIASILLFAGEATSPGNFSTVQGARLSGVREAERIIQLTKRYKGPPIPSPCPPCPCT